MTDLSDYASVGFTTRPASGSAQKHDLEFSFERAGVAGTTNTQALLRLTSPFRRPEWLQDLQDNRRSWKNRTKHFARLYEVSLVLYPANPECRILEVN